LTKASASIAVIPSAALHNAATGGVGHCLPDARTQAGRVKRRQLIFTVPVVRTRPERLHTAMQLAGVGGFLGFDFGAALGHAAARRLARPSSCQIGPGLIGRSVRTNTKTGRPGDLSARQAGVDGAPHLTGRQIAPAAK